MKLGSDFRELLQLLNEFQVKYMVVGAYALAAYGFPRNTKDLDIFYEASGENAPRVMQALDRFGFANLGLTLEDFSTPGQIIQLGYPPNRIDLISDISGVSFEEAWRNRVRVSAEDPPYDIIGQAEYIKNKRASGRHSDLADIERLGEKP